MKKIMTTAMLMAAFVFAGANATFAGDRDWATAGKILTGVVGLQVLANSCAPRPVVYESGYYAAPRTVVYESGYYAAPRPVVYETGYYARPVVYEPAYPCYGYRYAHPRYDYDHGPRYHHYGRRICY